MSRQNYYKARKSRQRRKVDATYVVDRVKHVRFKHPRMGARKLLRVLSSDFSSHGIQIGRDRFFDLLREHSLLVKRRKKFARTTNSYHSLPVFHNIFKDLCLYKPNQAWVSDLTYIRVRESFIFLSLVTDAYSRKIVGYHGGDSLEAVGCIEALKMAIKDLPEGERPIHHSDRGSQYCCHAYVDILTRAGFGISMTEENHCYENALAERVNGILKDEYNLSYTFPGVQEARIAIDQAIGLYNFERPHLSLGYRTPNDIHEKAA